MLSALQAIPFEIASWCEPENAVNTKSPAYGWRGPTFILVTRSYISQISGILLKSRCGSTPCEIIFIAKVTISTLPVLSPFPNKVPSILSAPAKTLNSAVATPQPLSLWGWTEIVTASRYFKFLCIYSIWVAKTCGMAFSTVAGKLIITLLSCVGFQTSSTALQTSNA